MKIREGKVIDSVFTSARRSQQRRLSTARSARRKSSTIKNMQLLNWTPLSERRARAKLLTLYKARAREIEIPLDDLISTDPHISTRSSSLNYRTPHSSVDSHLYSFFPNTIGLWNNIPQQTKVCGTIADFKRSLETQTLRDSYN